MRLVTFIAREGTPARLGAQIGEQIVDLPGAVAARARVVSAGDSSVVDAALFPRSVMELLQAGEAAQEQARQALRFASEPETLGALARLGLAYPSAEVRFLPPITNPGKIICVGLNYRGHILEMGRELPPYPVLFAKFANTLIGHREPIVMPKVSDKVDYEAELAVVIGRTGKEIAARDAFDYIAGYTIFNDATVRDYQRRTIQFLQGKTFDGMGPIGPALVTADEVSDPGALDITLRLNGEVMQHSNTSDFIFDIPTTVEYLSQIMTLEPGDIIATGTPDGVGFARDPQVFLRPGDTVHIEIDELGLLENPVVAP